MVGSPFNHQPTGLVKLGLVPNSLPFLLCQKTCSGTACPGKLWLNSARSSLCMKSENHVQDLSTSSPDLTTLVQKPTSIMASPLLWSLLNVHRIPGEKNTDRDNLSRGKTSSFSHKWKICFNLCTIFGSAPLPRYFNRSDHWSDDMHAGAKGFFFFLFFCSFSSSLSLSISFFLAVLSYFLLSPLSCDLMFSFTAVGSIRLNEAHHHRETLPHVKHLLSLYHLALMMRLFPTLLYRIMAFDFPELYTAGCQFDKRSRVPNSICSSVLYGHPRSCIKRSLGISSGAILQT